jgi:hypothetical protein
VHTDIVGSLTFREALFHQLDDLLSEIYLMRAEALCPGLAYASGPELRCTLLANEQSADSGPRQRQHFLLICAATVQQPE